MSSTNKAEITLIAERYAIALFELGEKDNKLDEYDADLQKIKATLDLSKDLSVFLAHPTISIGDKKEILDSIFKSEISQHSLNLMKLLLDRNRIFILTAIVNNFHTILNKKKNIVLARVITAVEINEDIKNRVKGKLENKFSKQIELESKIDPEIIAGMIVEIGDKIIDGSVKTKLENMRRQLI